jgi:hypothetical protein
MHRTPDRFPNTVAGEATPDVAGRIGGILSIYQRATYVAAECVILRGTNPYMRLTKRMGTLLSQARRQPRQLPAELMGRGRGNLLTWAYWLHSPISG